MNAIHGCVPLIHASHFERAGMFDEKLAYMQDYEFLFRVLRGRRSVFLPEGLVRVRLHPMAGHVAAPDFGAECARQNAVFAQALTEAEIREMFRAPSIFYHRVAAMLWARGLPGEGEKFLELASRTAGKAEQAVDFAAVLRRLCGGNYRGICIYGMGYHGKLLACELYGRGLEPDWFCDSAAGLHGTEFRGVRCVPPESLQGRPDVPMIVSPDDSALIEKELKEKGFRYVLGKGAVLPGILEAPPCRFGGIS